MDAVSTLLDALKKSRKTTGNLQGFLHVMIGRTITRTSDQTIVSKGMGWRELASLLKKLRWDPDAVRELGFDPHDLPPRDRRLPGPEPGQPVQPELTDNHRASARASYSSRCHSPTTKCAATD